MPVNRAPSVRAVVLYSIICGVLAFPVTSLAQVAFDIRYWQSDLIWLSFETVILSPLGALFGLLSAFLGLLFRDLGATPERSPRTESLLLGTGQIAGLIVCYLVVALFAPPVFSQCWEVISYAIVVGLGGYGLSMRAKTKLVRLSSKGCAGPKSDS